MTVPQHQPKAEKREYPCRSSAIPRMRADLGSILSAWGLADIAPDASQCVSELGTNALLHKGRSPFGGHEIHMVTSITDAGRVRVEVHDAWPGVPQLRTAAGEDEDGRGLFLVSSLAVDWGVAPRPGGGKGKSVWFEFALPVGWKPARGRHTGPNIGVVETGDQAYPYRIEFDPKAADGLEHAHLTTAQAMTLVARLAPMLGLELAPGKGVRG